MGQSETFWRKRSNLLELHGVCCSVEGFLEFDIIEEGQNLIL
jgi:hypothetical protein